MHFNQPSFLMFFSAAVSLYIAALAWKRKSDSSIRTLSWLLISSAIWSVGYGFELAAGSLVQAQFFGFIAYIGIVSTPVFWMLFAARYTQNDHWISGKKHLLTLVVPMLSLIFLSSNNWHYLFYKTVEWHFDGKINYQQIVYGPLWYFHAGYSYLAGVLGIIFFIRMFVRSARENRPRIAYFLFGGLIPYIVNYLYVTGFKPYGYLDLTPAAFILMGALLVFGIHRIQLFNIKPLALDVLFNNLPNPIFVLDEQSRIINTNPAARELLQTIKTEHKAGEAMHGNDGEIIRFLLESDATDFVIGSGIYFRSIRPISLGGEQKAGSLIILRDITEAKKAEQSLIRSEQRFRLILENMPILLNAFDENGQFIVWNKACEYTTGYKVSEIIGNPKAMELLYPDLEYRQQVIAASDSNQNKQNTFSLVTKSGEKRTIAWFDTYHHLHIPGWASWGLGIDITEKEIAEQALRTSEKSLRELNASKDRFFSILAHDLRSPFNSILGLSELLGEVAAEKDFESVEKYASVIHTTARSTFDLLINLLEWSQTQTGKMQFLPEYHELTALVEEETQLLTNMAELKGISIKFDFAGKMLVYVDKQMLSTILRNLISNAIKFSNEGSTIGIKGRKHTQGVIVSIQDQGVGMAAEDIKKLFNLEENFTSKGTKNEKGTGLGLILCKEFVERHNGKIWVESTPGKGSCFHFTLPMLSTEL